MNQQVQTRKYPYRNSSGQRPAPVSGYGRVVTFGSSPWRRARPVARHCRCCAFPAYVSLSSTGARRNSVACSAACSVSRFPVLGPGTGFYPCQAACRAYGKSFPRQAAGLWFAPTPGPVPKRGGSLLASFNDRLSVARVFFTLIQPDYGAFDTAEQTF